MKSLATGTRGGGHSARRWPGSRGPFLLQRLFISSDQPALGAGEKRAGAQAVGAQGQTHREKHRTGFTTLPRALPRHSQGNSRETRGGSAQGTGRRRALAQPLTGPRLEGSTPATAPLSPAVPLQGHERRTGPGRPGEPGLWGGVEAPSLLFGQIRGSQRPRP